MPSSWPCMANNPAGTKLGAASRSPTLSWGLVKNLGGAVPETPAFPAEPHEFVDQLDTGCRSGPCATLVVGTTAGAGAIA